MYADVSGVDDLREALDRVAAAEMQFMGLDSQIRKAAMNDPVELLQMLATEEGREILEDSGMDFGARVEPIHFPHGKLRFEA